MPQFKTGNNLGLLNAKVDAEDISFLSSAYFLITEFNGNFKLGKNSLTVNNPPSDIKVEAYDSNGNVLYYEKAVNNDFIRNTQAITYSFHVYNQNPSGIGKIILIGTFNRKIIRYISNVNIDTVLINDSKVRFYNQPIIEVTPLLSYVTQTSTTETNPKTSSGLCYSTAILPGANFNIDASKYNKNNIDYQVVTKTTSFSASFQSFGMTFNINKIRNPNGIGEIEINQTSSVNVKNVINYNTLQLESPIIYKNPANNKNIVVEITSGSYSLNYSSYNYKENYFTNASYVSESVNGVPRYKKVCIAEITYKNLDTFSGTVVRHKVYRKSLNIASDYILLLDENFSNNEQLRNNLVPIKSYQNLGNFYTQSFINNFWFSSNGSTSLTYDSSSYIDALNINSTNTITNGYILAKLNTDNVNYRNSTYRPYNQNEYLNQSGSSYDTNFLKFNQKTDYVLSFNCNLLSKNQDQTAYLDFYLTGSYINNNKESNYNSDYGVKLASIEINDNSISKNFYNTLQFKFTPVNDIYGTIVIVPKGFKSLAINNLSIKYDRTNGFSPTSYTVRVPFNVNQAKELYDIKSELYDNNSNLVYSNLRTIQTFDPNGESSPASNTDVLFSNLTATGTIKFVNLPIISTGYKYVVVDTVTKTIGYLP
jgi:hypothetical protein